MPTTISRVLTAWRLWRDPMLCHSWKSAMRTARRFV